MAHMTNLAIQLICGVHMVAHLEEICFSPFTHISKFPKCHLGSIKLVQTKETKGYKLSLT
jgi:hypothetical protein